MKDYFYYTLSRCFGNAIYAVYGSVAISMFSNNKETAVRLVAYGISNEELQKLDKEEQNTHIVVDKCYDISDVDFDDKYSVSKNIHDIVKSFELDIYNVA